MRSRQSAARMFRDGSGSSQQTAGLRRAAVRAVTDLLEPRRLLAAFTVDPNASTSATNFHTISDAINAAGLTVETDDTVDVVAGAFTENVLVNTPLTLRGAKFGQDPRPGRGAGETLITGQIAVTAGDVTVDGFTILDGSSSASPSIAGVYVNASTVTISNNVLVGASSGSGILTGAAVTAGVSLSQNIATGWSTGVNLVGDGVLTVGASRLNANAVGLRVTGQAATVTLSGNEIQDNSAAGVEIDLATLSGTASVSLTGNTLGNANVPQFVLGGGDITDAVTFSGNAASLAGTATYVNTLAATPVSGLSTTLFTILRTTSEDTALDINLDVDGSGLASTDATGLAGSLTTAGNVVTYTPASNFSGTTSFTFTTTGGATGSVNLTVTATNDEPTLSGDNAFSVDEGGAYVLTTDDLSASDVDLPAQTLTFTASAITGGQLEFVSNPGVAITTFTQAQLAAGEVRYVHGGGEASSASITYSVSDGVASSSSSPTLGVTVNAVNDAPVLGPIGTLDVNEGGTVVVTSSILDGDDVDDAAVDLVYTIVAVPAHGTLKRGAVSLSAGETFTQADVDSGLVSYAHDGGETTGDGFTFTLSDGDITTATQSMSITVTATNDEPTLSGDNAFSVDEGGAYVLTTDDLSASDVDLPAQTLTFTASAITGGQLEFVSNPGVAITTFTQAQLAAGEVRYVHGGGEASSASITYSVSDGVASSSSSPTLGVTVNAVNDAPTATDGSLVTGEDAAYTGTLVGNDVDSASLTYAVVAQPSSGTVVITDAATGAFTFTPASNWNGTTSFTFNVSDGSATSNTATVSVTVNPSNDVPVASTIPTTTIDEGQLATIALADFFSDADASDLPPDVLSYSLSGAPSFVSINPTTGVVTIAPGATDAGSYSFTAIATDQDSATASTTVSLVVNNVVNNPPVLGNVPATVAVAENTLAPVFDVDATDPDAGQTLSYSIVGGNGSGLFAIDPNTGVITLTGTLDAEATSQFNLTIRVTDNGPPAVEFTDAVLTVNVSDVNDEPTLVSLSGPAAANEGNSATYVATASDADAGAVLEYVWFVNDVEQSGETGSSFIYTYPDGGSYTIRVEVSDRGGTAAVASQAVAVSDVAPTLSLSTSAPNVNEGSSFSLNIGPIVDPGVGDVASVGQVAVWWQDGTYTLINESVNPELLDVLRAGGTVSVSHIYSDGQNMARPMTVSVFSGQQSNVFNTSIVVNNVAPTGNFAAITPTIQAGSIAVVNWFGQTDVSSEDRLAGLRYTYILDVNVPGGDGVYNAGDILLAGDGTYAGSSTLTSLQIPGSQFATAGTYSVLGLLIDKDASPILTRQVSIVVTPSTFQVVSLGGDHSGFTVVFNREINLSSLNLYDGTDPANDTADVILTRSSGQQIRGTLVLNAARNGFDFLVTGGILSQGTYTVRLNSGVNAFKDLAGSALDGDYSGAAGGNYIANFGVNAPPGPVLSTPDFARGPGQTIDIIPGNTASDLPISMNTNVAVSSINFTMRYDATLMNITNIVAGAGLPAGWQVDYSIVSGGVNISLIKVSPTAANMAIGMRELLRVVASVPNDASLYGRSQVLSFASIVVNGNESIEGTADRSVHKVVFLGDANRDGTVNVGDAALIQSVVLNSVTGFDAYPIVDPVIVADSSRNVLVDSQDATNAALSGFTGGRPADVPAFTPVAVPVTPGIDPTFGLPSQLLATPGSTVTVPLQVTDDGRGVQAGQIRIAYDTTLLDLSDLDILAGSLLASGWQVLANVNDTEGWVEVGFFSGNALAGASALTGTLVNLNFLVSSSASDGVTPLTIATPLNTPLSPTLFYNRQGGLLTTAALSGSLLIDAFAPSVATSTFNFNTVSQSFTVVFSEDVSASLAAGDFELLNLTTGTAVDVVIASISSDGKTAVLSFANTGGLTSTMLKDGDYRLRIRAGQVADLAGRVNAADIDSTFFFLNADLNRDRVVNFDDLLLLAQNYGIGSGATFGQGDVNYDGTVSFDDLLVLAQRYGTTLAVAPTGRTGRRGRWSETVIE